MRRGILAEGQSWINEEVDKTPKRIGEDMDEISCSGEEDAVMEGMIVMVDALQKAKKKRNKKKQKSKTTVEKEVETPAPAGMNLEKVERRINELKEIGNGLVKGDREGLNRVKSEYQLMILELERLQRG